MLLAAGYVLEHEPVLVNGQVGLEIALLVAVAILGQPGVALNGALEAKLGPDDPRDGNLGLLPDLQPEAADRQRVRRRREAEIHIGAVPVLGRALLAGPQRDRSHK